MKQFTDKPVALNKQLLIIVYFAFNGRTESRYMHFPVHLSRAMSFSYPNLTCLLECNFPKATF